MSYKAKTGCGMMVSLLMIPVVYAFGAVAVAVMVVAAAAWLLAWAGRKSGEDVSNETTIDGR